ncbi:aminotransferase class I and II [Schizosaccharomyces octosporus yFS286]|uniref:Aminotransferase class I and II n=1 Tax=Schizosaccharomyces octosporus (strain yFS286) TaxID=483514 RepID=S9QWM8_SCHOY|nr:aminotransferase class I and II [Schizosaccharomyces octosporus yFS286]EPX70710.1 aminotransferase class I and II [Schizosaccharomyces octosporus yFS286]
MTTNTILPSFRVAGSRPDVWTMVNQATAECKVPPVSLSQGFFNYSPPKFVLDAAKKCIDDVSCNQYSHTRGRISLRNALSKAYSPLFNRKLNPDTEIVVTAGANEGFYSVFAAYLNPGDEVILMEPFFDQYVSNVQMNGGVPVYVPMIPPKEGAEHPVSAKEWKLDMNRLRAAITNKTKMIVINTPHNPLGKVFSEEELNEIADIVLKHNLLVVSDEVYDRLFYTPFVRLATLRPELFRHVVTVGSGGKTFGCTGWRVGWIIGDESIIKHSAAAHTRICFCVNSPLQEATAIAFEEANKVGYWDEYISTYKKRFSILAKAFDQLGIPYTIPDGSYYVMANFAKVKMPENYPFPEHILSRPRDFQLCFWMLKEIGVATIPPTEFYTDEDAFMAQDYLRFSFCKTYETLEEGAKRLQKLKDFI